MDLNGDMDGEHDYGEEEPEEEEDGDPKVMAEV